MKVRIDEERFTISGKPMFWLYAEEDGNNQHGKEVEEGEQFAGFFRSEDEARAWAKEHGCEVEEDD